MKTNNEYPKEALKCLNTFSAAVPESNWQRLFTSLLILAGNWCNHRCNLYWRVKKTPTQRYFIKLLAAKSENILPTPLAADGKRSAEIVTGKRKTRPSGHTHSSTLVDLAFSSLLPTPTTGENRNSRNTVLKIGSMHVQHGVALGLAQVIEISMGILPKEFKGWHQVPAFYKMLPTPTCREYKGGRSPEGLFAAGRTSTNSLNDYLNVIAGKQCKLSPLFVTQMMGFPVDWTLLPFTKTQ